MRIGTGWDIHRLIPGRPLVLAGVIIPSDRGADAHSDGDAAIHALIDALLGAAALGDIGTHFPPSDDAFKGIDSARLLKKTLSLISDYRIINVDITIVLQSIRLAPHISEMRERLAYLLDLPFTSVSVKAKTAEKLLGELGTGEAVEAMASVLLHEKTVPLETDGDQWV
ncbi:MAG: 2-C-methyl-D-erythritol 2,4-cyclodiphosphate synthase [Sphaerochaetaceae bacterium]|nr:2-C-methyl-D-erythritol 2,4-cyclodiphosphate synthase [Sphaerochaetaceae bacterium]